MTRWRLQSCAGSLVLVTAVALWTSVTLAQDLSAVLPPRSRPDGFCLACHADESLRTKAAPSAKLHVDPDAYSAGKHAKAGVTCSVCHPAMGHIPHPPHKPLRQESRAIVMEVCSICHAAQYLAYKSDVHGRAFLDRNNLDAASCTDCHGMHALLDSRAAAFRLSSTAACSKCHADRAMMARYGVWTESVASYEAEFHGLSTRLSRNTPGATPRWAVCTDCHGAHPVKKMRDSPSNAAATGLSAACRACHAGATERFALASTGHAHIDRSSRPSQLASQFYRLAIPGGLGVMLLYMLLESVRYLATKRTRPS